MLKLMYLAKRKPGFTTDQFVCRWRMHGATAMAQPLWRHTLGYVQAEPIRPAPIAGASEEFDAVASFIIRDEMYANMTEEDIAGAMKIAEDELQTFSAPIPTTAMWVTEEQIRPAELGGISAYLFFTDSAKARATAERANGKTQLNRITLNLRDDSSLGPDANTLPYSAIVELSTSSIESLAGAVETDRSDLLNDADLTVVTRDAVLWDRLAC